MSILEFAQAGTHPRYFREIEMPILLYLLPDDELPERLRKERPGSAPMTVPLITERQTVDFSQDMQEFVYSLNYGMPRARLTVPELPYSTIEAMGAKMYKGQRPIIGDTGEIDNAPQTNAETEGASPIVSLSKVTE